MGKAKYNYNFFDKEGRTSPYALQESIKQMAKGKNGYGKMGGMMSQGNLRIGEYRDKSETTNTFSTNSSIKNLLAQSRQNSIERESKGQITPRETRKKSVPNAIGQKITSKKSKNKTLRQNSDPVLEWDTIVNTFFEPVNDDDSLDDEPINTRRYYEPNEKLKSRKVKKQARNINNRSLVAAPSPRDPKLEYIIDEKAEYNKKSFTNRILKNKRKMKTPMKMKPNFHLPKF